MKTLASMNLGGPTLTPKHRGLPYRASYYFLKGLNFLGRYHDNPCYVFWYVCFFWRKDYREPVLFLTDEEYLEKAKTTSTIRLGEGEFTLMLGTRDIVVQKFDPALKEFFYQVAAEYGPEQPYLLAMPSHLNIANEDLERWNARYLWMPGKILFRMYFNRRAWYSDASFFYRDGMTRRFLGAMTPNRRVVYVTNARNIEGLKRLAAELTPEASAVAYVETPPASTFALRDQVLANIREAIKERPHEAVVIFACGPAGKVLGRILAKEGVLAHDVGSGIAFLFDGQSHEQDIGWASFKTLFEKNRDHDRKAS